MMRQAEQDIGAQDQIEKREKGFAAEARTTADRNRTLADQCSSYMKLLGSSLPRDPATIAPAALPPDNDIADFVAHIVGDLNRSKHVFDKAVAAIHGGYKDIRKFLTSNTFEGLKGEKEVAVNLAANDSLVVAENATRTAALINDRLRTIDHDLSNLDDDLQTCVGQLDTLVLIARRILQRMV